MDDNFDDICKKWDKYLDQFYPDEDTEGREKEEEESIQRKSPVYKANVVDGKVIVTDVKWFSE